MSKILVVEDSPTQATRAEFILREAGFDVVLAQDAEAGMEKFAADDFDLVLTDLTLPGKSGFELCRFVKKDSRGQRVPVVVLTGSAEAQDVLRGLEAGADGYLSKDRTHEEIVDGVRETIAQGDRLTAAGTASPVQVRFMDHQFEVTAGREQLLGVLLSAFEDVARLNQRYLDEIRPRRQAEEDQRQIAAELERSNRDLEDFANIVSHDLQAPLRSVVGYCQLLQRRYEGKLDAEADEFIDFAVGGAKRMHTLIRDLLAYSRVGTSDKEFRPTDCSAVYDEVLVNLAAEIKDAGAEVTRDPLPTVLADYTQMSQLLQNLIGNAVKFRADQAPSVHVSARRDSQHWLFSVQDNGIGIDPKHAERIFQTFRRLHTTEEYEGTGMGLTICKRIVERHGGRIWMESNPGEGSTFCFVLPVIPEQES